MNFSEALKLLKEGKKVKRSIWGGYWFIPHHCEGFLRGSQIEKFKYSFVFNTMIVACLKDGGGYVPATPYQDDILAEDWEIVE